MKKTVLLLLSVLLLFGCAQNVPDLPSQSADIPTVAPTEATLPPETLPPETQPPETDPQPDPLAQLAASMTLPELVGQLFLIRCPETDVQAVVDTTQVGGLLLFGRDIDGQTPETLTQTITAYQAAAKIPLLIAVDEEGGTVCRVSSHEAFRSSRFPSPRQLYDEGGLEAVLETEDEKCDLLRSVGIRVNLAPVCDIATDPAAFMYHRSLGQSPQITAEFASRMVERMKEGGIGCALKHFPGYGNNADTHTGIAVDDRSYAELAQNDLVPFRAGIEAGCGCILVAHTVVTALDSEYPASLSPVLHELLRQELGFAGVILTDDLSMQAITDAYGAGEAAVLAVEAGNDLLCSTDYEAQIPAVIEAVETGRISRERIEQSVLRILSWKQSLGLLPEDAQKLP